MLGVLFVFVLCVFGWQLVKPKAEPPASPAPTSTPPIQQPAPHAGTSGPAGSDTTLERSTPPQAPEAAKPTQAELVEVKRTSPPPKAPSREPALPTQKDDAPAVVQRSTSKGRLRINAGNCSQLLINGKAVVFDSLEHGCIVTERTWPPGPLKLTRVSSAGHRVVVRTVVSSKKLTVCALKSTEAASSCQQEPLDTSTAGQ